MGKQPLTMYQLKHFFNTCRIPHKACDELISSFRTGLFDSNQMFYHYRIYSITK